MQCISRQNSGGLIEGLMRCRFASTQVIIIHRRQIIVDQGVTVNQLNRTGGYIRRRQISTHGLVATIHQHRTNAFAGTEPRILHRRQQLAADLGQRELAGQSLVHTLLALAYECFQRRGRF